MNGVGRGRRRLPPFLSRPRKGKERRSYAAVDLGTNNCRLLIARTRGSDLKVVDSFSRIVRLGEGVGRTGRLGEEAVRRAIGALKVCAAKMKRGGVAVSRSVATEACRIAENGEEFVGRVERETGVVLEVISPEEEARLILDGCAPLLDPAVPNALVFDIGGGSTELISVHREATGSFRLHGFASLPCGVVTLAERHGEGPVTPADRERMIGEVAPQLAAFEARHGLSTAIEEGGLQILGTSGTVTTLAGFLLGLPAYDRAKIDGLDLAFAEIERASRKLWSMDVAERARHPCIGRGRADLVAAGCAVLAAICRAWPTGRLRVADRGVREGILYGLVRKAGESGSRGGAQGEPGDGGPARPIG